jgi:hypothetical protein
MTSALQPVARSIDILFVRKEVACADFSHANDFMGADWSLEIPALAVDMGGYWDLADNHRLFSPLA